MANPTTAVAAAIATKNKPFVAPKHIQKFMAAAAGHDGVLSDESGTLLIKPCLHQEVAFYQSALEHQSELACLMPTFLGTLQLNETNTLSLENPPPAPSPVTSLSSATTTTTTTTTKKPPLPTAIVLSNLAHPFVRPCVLDIKLGARLWDDSASLDKRTRLDAVAEATTSKPLGLRIAGMKVWKGEKEEYRDHDKQYGRQFTKENVINGMNEFFTGASVVAADRKLNSHRNPTKPEVESKSIAGTIAARASDAKEQETNGSLLENKNKDECEKEGGDGSTSQGDTKSMVKYLANRFLIKTLEVQRVLESIETRIYSASLLFIYEGDEEALKEAIDREEKYHVKVTTMNRQSNNNSSQNHNQIVENKVELEGRETGENHDDEDDQDDLSDDEEDDDDDDDDDEEEEEERKVEELKLIDFAHANWTPGQGPDENMLYGVRSLVRLLQQISDE